MNMEEFEMYAMYVNEPYIVEEKDVQTFLKNRGKPNKFVNEISKIFKDEWFEFSLDENGYMSGIIEVEEVEVDSEEENDD